MPEVREAEKFLRSTICSSFQGNETPAEPWPGTLGALGAGLARGPAGLRGLLGGRGCLPTVAPVGLKSSRPPSRPPPLTLPLALTLALGANRVAPEDTEISIVPALP